MISMVVVLEPWVRLLFSPNIFCQSVLFLRYLDAHGSILFAVEIDDAIYNCLSDFA
jgi:hypothetical protein